MEIRETKIVKDALKLAEIIVAADNPVGEIVGPAGTGKSMAGRAVTAHFNAVRVVGYEGVSRHQMAGQVAQALGLEGANAALKMLERVAEPNPATRRLLVVDEANKLSWRVLEMLRYLADECNTAVLLIGTELYDRQFRAGRTRDLLIQLGSRIGAKRAATRHLDRAETFVHIFKPQFGEAEKDLITAFWEGCRRGNYREAGELAGECRRLMAANGMQSLTPAVLELAVKWMANRREA